VDGGLESFLNLIWNPAARQTAPSSYLRTLLFLTGPSPNGISATLPWGRSRMGFGICKSLKTKLVGKFGYGSFYSTLLLLVKSASLAAFAFSFLRLFQTISASSPSQSTGPITPIECRV
jgi:hypothetical protein